MAQVSEARIAQELAAFECDERHQNGKYAVLKLKNQSETNVVVPRCVEVIAASAFEGSDVMIVELPEGLLKIGDRAFANCRELRQINLPESLLAIGREAFVGCALLDTRVPAKARVEENAFLGTKAESRMAEEAKKQADRETAAGMDAQIAALDRAPRTHTWRNEVEKLEKQIKKLPPYIRELCVKLPLLDHYHGEFEWIDAAEEIDGRIRILDQLPRKDEAWALQLKELDSEIPEQVRPYLTEQEKLVGLMKEADRYLQAIEDKARKDALQMDAKIGALANMPRDIAWCTEVERLERQVKRLPAQV
jgi:hypothetical protein